MNYPSAYSDYRRHEVLASLWEVLVQVGFSETRSTDLVERIHDFHNSLSRILRVSAPLGLAVDTAEGGRVHIWLTLCWPAAQSQGADEQSRQRNDVSEYFSDTLSLPSRPNPRFHLDFVLPGQDGDASPEAAFREVALAHGTTYLGILRSVSQFPTSPKSVR